MHSSDHILKIHELRVVFGIDNPVVAVSNLSQVISRGKIIGVVGESGSGKSVTALSILKLLPKGHSRLENGKIIYTDATGADCDLLALDAKEIRAVRGKEIAMVFQEPMTSLNPVYTCGEQVSEVIRLHLGKNRTEAKKQTLKLFEKVRLAEPERVYRSYPHQLSGGQKQRVMIAMALSCRPRLLIADEPTTALDVTVQADIIRLLKNLQRENEMSVIFITHDLGVVAEIADQVLVMYKGEIVEKGAVDDIFNNPQHNYTKGLLECRPSLTKKLKKLPTVGDFLNSESDAVQNETLWTESELVERTKMLAESKVLIDVQDLSLTYTDHSNTLFSSARQFKALDDINFSIKRGETLGLVGESGCGKSTLGKSIARLIQPDSGEIYYEGIDLLKLDRSEMRKMRRRIQIIFQDPYASLNPRMKIGDAIAEPMLFHGLVKGRRAARQAVEQLLDRVGLLAEHYDRYPHEFSGGQRQRVGIARALAVQPEFIICDESVSALDVSVQAQVLNLLVDLREEYKLTYLFISHDLSVINFISDRILVMKAGEIVETGSPDDIFHNTQSEYTKKLIESIPGS